MITKAMFVNKQRETTADFSFIKFRNDVGGVML